jgi:hypothetical protein
LGKEQKRVVEDVIIGLLPEMLQRKLCVSFEVGWYHDT